MRFRMLRSVLLAILLSAFFLAVPSSALTIQLKVAFQSNQAPYHFLSESGEAVGMHIEMLNVIAESSGLELEYMPMKTSSECIEALESGQVDLVLDVARRLGDSQWVTIALSEETLCTISQDSSPTSEGDARQVAALQLGTLTPSIMQQLNTVQLYLVPNQEKAMGLLMDGTVDMAVVLKESALYHLDKTKDFAPYVITNNYMGVVSFALRVPDNDYSLLQSLNRGITSLRTSGAYATIREQWSYQKPETERALVWLKGLVIVLTVTVLVIGSYAVTVTLVRRTLHKQVEKQTAALRQANREIQTHMEQLKSESDIRNRIIRYSHLGMALFDRKHEIKLINDSALILSGEIDRPSDIRVLPVFGDIVQVCGTENIFRQSGIEGAKTISLERSGREKQYRYSFQQLSKSGKIWAVLLMVEDITDEEARRHVKFEEEKSQTLNQVVAGIAHEIKNPLMSIKTFANALRDESANPRFIEDFTKYVPSEVERINRLVEGLIGYAKPAKGTAEPLDLSELVRETVFFAKNLDQSARIEVHETIEDGHIVVGIRDQIKQILINIIANGMESMREKLCLTPEKKPLLLNISLSGDAYCSLISIRDEGMGMSREAIERCMDPFFTTKQTGTGLGLTLSKQYVKGNNGQMQIASEVGLYTEIQISFRREFHENQNISCG